MYKNGYAKIVVKAHSAGFNPCFNGSMYKNLSGIYFSSAFLGVSILVLMDLCIKTYPFAPYSEKYRLSFNPCFNGSMYKNKVEYSTGQLHFQVSILVLMDLCIKTVENICHLFPLTLFQSLF